ncbi:MAG: hypothetical protein J7L37_01310 [Thermococcus sp.]|nr:hypothetical protein [Thermococcus sp.]
MKLKAVLIIALLVLSLGCLRGGVNTKKPAVEFKAVANQESLNQSVEVIEYFLLEIQREYILPWENSSVTISEKLPIVFVKMKNGSHITGAQELDGNVFLLNPWTEGEGRPYSCHCTDGKRIDFKVFVNVYAFRNVTTFNVNYEVRKLGSGEYQFTTIGYSVERVKIFGETYTLKLGESEGTWSSNNVIIEPLGNYTYRVRIRRGEEHGVKITLSTIPIILTGEKRNVTITTLPLDVDVVKEQE